jgi:hypothetical protein
MIDTARLRTLAAFIANQANLTDEAQPKEGPGSVKLNHEEAMLCVLALNTYVGNLLVPQMLTALIAQHEAIDRLFALLIAKTMNAEKPFFPSESGQPWDALIVGKATIEAALAAANDAQS